MLGLKLDSSLPCQDPPFPITDLRWAVAPFRKSFIHPCIGSFSVLPRNTWKPAERIAHSGEAWLLFECSHLFEYVWYVFVSIGEIFRKAVLFQFQIFHFVVVSNIVI